MINKNHKLFSLMIMFIFSAIIISILFISFLSSKIYRKNVYSNLFKKSNKAEAEPVSWSKNDPVLAPDFSNLYFASDKFVIFRVNTGLFVYNIDTESIYRTLDLQYIDCHYIEGDNYCETLVSEDGSYVFLHPLSSDMMYVYAVEENILFLQTFSADIMNDIKIFNHFINPVDCELIPDGVIGGRIVEIADSKTNEKKRAYLLIKSPYRLSDVKFILGEKEISLFNN